MHKCLAVTLILVSCPWFAAQQITSTTTLHSGANCILREGAPVPRMLSDIALENLKCKGSAIVNTYLIDGTGPQGFGLKGSNILTNGRGKRFESTWGGTFSVPITAGSHTLTAAYAALVTTGESVGSFGAGVYVTPNHRISTSQAMNLTFAAEPGHKYTINSVAWMQVGRQTWSPIVFDVTDEQNPRIVPNQTLVPEVSSPAGTASAQPNVRTPGASVSPVPQAPPVNPGSSGAASTPPSAPGNKPMDNDAVVRLVQAGLSDDVIVTAINAKPGNYDTSAVALNALKGAGASGTVIAAVVLKSSGSTQRVAANPASPPPVPALPSAPGVSAAPASPPLDARPGVPLSFCSFQVSGTDATGIGVRTVPSNAAMLHAGDEQDRYFASISPQVQRTYETAIEEMSEYKLVNSEQLALGEYTKHPSLSGMARENNLFACLAARPLWGNKAGWEKTVEVSTKWEVETSTGCKLKFTTTVATDKTYGHFPRSSDPKLQSVFLGLTKDDGREFLLELRKQMQKAGCAEPGSNP